MPQSTTINSKTPYYGLLFLLTLVWIIQGSVLYHQWNQSPLATFLPYFGSRGQALLFMSFVMVAALLYMVGRSREVIVTLFVLPPIIILMFVSLALRSPIAIAHPSIANMNLVAAHVLCFLIGIAFLALAILVGALLVIQDRRLKKRLNSPVFDLLPSLQKLDDLVAHFVLVGFGFVTIGFTLSLVLAHKSWSLISLFEPKLIGAACGWTWFALLLIARMVYGWRGRRLAIATMVGFVLAFVIYYLAQLGGFGFAQ